jgi:hypothetical protein
MKPIAISVAQIITTHSGKVKVMDALQLDKEK